MPSQQALEQAAEWFALLLSGQASEAERRAWGVWLSDADEHAQAWQHIEALNRRFASLKEAAQPQLVASAWREAHGAAGRRRRALLGVGAMGGLGLLTWQLWPHVASSVSAQAWLADYRSDTGEVREVSLSDTTRVWLNARSAFNVTYRYDMRLLALIQGDVLIDTASDPQHRPFCVDTAQGARLQALGTRFAVRCDDKTQTTLAVYEGAVQARLANGAAVIVNAQQQVCLTTNAIGELEPVDPAYEAWTQGLLIARNLSLAEVVAQLRRYDRGYLSLAAEVADLRVFGSYPIRSPEQALKMLEAVLPIRVRSPLPGWRVIESRTPANAKKL